jgi:ribosomal protein L29
VRDAPKEAYSLRSRTKMAKIKELRGKNIEELKKLLAEKRESVRKLRFDVATKQVKNTRQIRNEKRDISRIETLINEEKTNGQNG